jgi:DME family drug/metabolite transporter
MSLTLPPSLRASRIGLLQVCLAGVLWGTGGLAVQAIRDITPLPVLTLSAYRMLIAAAVLAAAVALLRQGPQLRAALAGRRGRAALVGCGTGGYQALYFGSVVTAGVTVSTVVSLGLAPVLLTVWEAVRARRRPTNAMLLVLAAALTGLVLVTVFSGHGAGGPRPVLGIVLAIASGAIYALTTALGRPLAQEVAPLVLTTLTTSAGALALLPVAVLAGLGRPSFTTDPTAIAYLAYLGVFTMALAYGLLYAGLRTTTGSVAVLATLLEPVTAAVAAALLLDERIGPAAIAGIVLILVSITGLDRARAAPEPGRGPAS